MRVNQTTAVNKKRGKYKHLILLKGLEETKLQVPSIKEIRELIQKAKVLNLSKKFKEYYRPAPLPAMSPFVPDVPIVRQTLTNQKPMSAEVVEEIHKAGL